MGEILFLSHRIPFPPDRGDKIRSHHFLRALADRCPVHVATFAETEQDHAAEAQLAGLAKTHCLVARDMSLVRSATKAVLRREAVSLSAFRSDEITQWVQRTLAAHPIDTIFVFSGQMGQYVPDHFHGKVIVDLCDVDSEKFATYADERRFPLSLAFSREARLLRAEERKLAQRADRTVLISREERDLFAQSQAGRLPDGVSVIGNGIDSEFFDPAVVGPHPELRAEGDHFVFTGQMDYPPNIAAVKRFANSILPLMRGRVPARFHIVGRAPADEVVALEQREGITVWGEVPDVRPFLAGASAVVAPLTLARGVQNKVLEAMAMARPVLLSEEAATGIDAEDGHHFEICRDDRAFADVAEKLLQNPDRAKAMGRAARNFVIDRMSWSSVARELYAVTGIGDQDAQNAA